MSLSVSKLDLDLNILLYFQIQYDGIDYGRGMDERNKQLNVGLNMLNIGGDFLRIQTGSGFDTDLYCDRIYLIANIKEGKYFNLYAQCI